MEKPVNVPPDTCKQAMVDIESMSVHPSNALVLSLGVVGFEIKDEGPVFGKRYDWVFDLPAQLRMGRGVDPDTQAFWAKQPFEAAAHWMNSAGAVPIARALNEIAECLIQYETVWANGIVFDIGNLETLFRSTQIAVPWRYNAVRDARTIYRSFTKLRLRPVDLDIGPQHHPVTDCISQIWGLWEHWPTLATKPSAFAALVPNVSDDAWRNPA
jgi:3' exoribonuclease, RNase T-like